ncbi:MAG: DNA polymerase III subunit delta' [Burkholderiaceae bacterium]
MSKETAETASDLAPAATPAVLPPWLAKQRDALLSQRGHAWLLHGPSGLGQYELALSLAQAWLCEAPGKTASQAACGRCPSCHMIATHAHTDLVVLMPETLMIEYGWPLSEKAQKEIDDKSRKPSREIRVDAMRESIEFAQLTSGRGRSKAVLVYPAERMNNVTANALLKTLEEPTGDVKFALASEAAHQLLPTIRSRCQSFALHWPAQDEALAWLGSQTGGDKLDATALQTALAAAGGRPLDATQFIAANALVAWTKLPKALVLGAQGITEHWSPKTLLDALQKLCHDLWAIKLGAPPRFFAAADLPKAPPARALSAWSEQLKTLARSIEHTWKAELLLEDLVSQAKTALNSRQ